MEFVTGLDDQGSSMEVDDVDTPEIFSEGVIDSDNKLVYADFYMINHSTDYSCCLRVKMEGGSSFSVAAPPVFDRDNYQMWAVRMETYLKALDFWELVEEDYEVPPLPANPTVAKIKAQKEKKTRKSKAKACLFAAASQIIFTRIMSLKSAKEIWDYLKAEYEGDERIRGMKVLNLIRDFELQKMKESESVKEYSDRFLSIANKVRLLGSELNDFRILTIMEGKPQVISKNKTMVVPKPEKKMVAVITTDGGPSKSRSGYTEDIRVIGEEQDSGSNY
ncbi:hypothetical protein Gotur_035715 [Gossypium turneri]